MESAGRYRLIVTGRGIYKELLLEKDSTEVSVGTRTTDTLRLPEKKFFEEFFVTVYRQQDSWRMNCSENVYFSTGDNRKLLAVELSHGKRYVLRYKSTNNEFLSLEFKVNFERGAHKYDCFVNMDGVREIKIGTEGTKSDLCIKSEYSQSESIRLRTQSRELLLEEFTGKYGVEINGVRALRGGIIREKDFFSVAEIGFYYSGNGLFISDSEKIQSSKLPVSIKKPGSSLVYPALNRSTRMKIELDTEPIEVLDPPAQIQKPKGNIIMKLLPALAMIALVVVVRGFMSGSSDMSFVLFSVCSMSIGVFTSVVSFIGERRKYKQETKERKDTYEKYIEAKKREIESARAEEAEILNEIYFDAEKEIHNLEEFNGEIYDRKPDDKDYLFVRLGIGRQLSKRPVTYKKRETFAGTDALAKIPAEIEEQYRYVNEVPITVELGEISQLGIVGGAENVYELSKIMIWDLVSRQYPLDLELVLMIDEEQKDRYSWVRWLPHFYNEKLGVRNIVWNEESKNAVFEYLYSELAARENEKNHDRNIVVLMACDWGLKLHPLSNYMEKASSLGISFVCAETHEEQLPLGCERVIFIKDMSTAEIVDAENRRTAYDITLQTLKDSVVEEYSRRLAPVYCDEVSLENSLTKSISLFELLGIYTAEDIDFEKRWAASDIVKSMSAPIGVKTKDEVVYLDLHEKAHGPHGLVAGTTGSGKSETLQTYILSMATLFAPDEVGFVIIDFKGGGMVNQFANLPHLIGAITNIDGKEIDRSLLSIKAELQKRQRVFAEYGVNNINSYIELYKEKKAKEPIPHLILIVDEFAELKADQPEFMKELISASRIGRSLGVHLILATQKPSGQVSEQIWSNSKFKLCLKVQTREDSNEVLKSPLAAEIKEPGRAYLQVGNNELFELFQSAYSGARANAADGEKTFSISRMALGGLREVIYRRQKSILAEDRYTQLEAVVDAVANYCEEKGIRRLPNICLPALADKIAFAGEDGGMEPGHLRLPIGIFDDPANQYQGEYILDMSNDNVLLIGATQMGKTAFLQLLLRSLGMRCSVEELNIYIMDFASMTLKVFENMNQVGGVIVPGEAEKLKNLFKLLRSSVEERKEKLLAIGVSSYTSYVEAGNRDLPRILVLLDNFSVFKELYEEAYESEFQFLTREGPSYGVSFVVTNARTSGLGYRYMANFGIRMAMSCTESSEYANLFDRCRTEPKETPGRFLFKKDGDIYEAQMFLPFPGEKEVDRAKTIREFIQRVQTRYGTNRARAIPYVPEQLTWDFFRTNFVFSRAGYIYPLGLDYAEVEPAWLNTARVTELAIVAREEERRNMVINRLLGIFYAYAIEKPFVLNIVDNYVRSLKKWEDSAYIGAYTVDAYETDLMLEECERELERREDMVKNAGIQSMSEMPLLLYVFHNENILQHISDSKEMTALYEKITKMSRNLNVLFIFSNIEDGAVGYNSPALLKKLKEKRNMIIGQKLDGIRTIDIPGSTVRSMRGHVNGDVYLVNNDEIRRVRMIERERG